MGKRRFTPIAALAAMVALAAGACGGAAPSAAPPASAGASTPASTASEAPSIVPSSAKPGQIVNVGGKDHIVVRWYVGLGFDHLVFHAPGEDQRRFLEQFCVDVLPKLRERF